PMFEAVSLVREAVESCCERNVFATAATQMRTAAQQPIDAVLSMMPFLTRTLAFTPEMALRIFERFLHEKDRTRFGIMNAITSVARDTRDHVTRWDLEKLGGRIAVMEIPKTLPDKGAENPIPRAEDELVIAR